MRQVCSYDWAVHEDTFYTWLDLHPEFTEKYVRARERQADHFAAECIAIADDDERDLIECQGKDGNVYYKADSARVQRAALRINARQHQMARMSPRRWGERVSDGDEANMVPKAIIIVEGSGATATTARPPARSKEHPSE